VKDGAVVIGDTPFSVDESERTGEQETVAFVRPHDIRITRESNGGHTLQARVTRCHAAGSVATLELERLDGRGVFTAQLSKEEYQVLQPKTGEQLFVELRNLRLFTDDYSI
jgi:sulfate transport system ATP-binding protein